MTLNTTAVASNSPSRVPLEDITHLINAVINALPWASKAGPDAVLELVGLRSFKKSIFIINVFCWKGEVRLKAPGIN